MYQIAAAYKPQSHKLNLMSRHFAIPLAKTRDSQDNDFPHHSSNNVYNSPPDNNYNPYPFDKFQPLKWS